jgi:glutamine---fructose-6-phosphate transaminase (isomerizing)
MSGEPGRSTREEILSQPEVWERVLAGLDRDVADLPDPSQFDEVLFTGCGSTHYLSLWAARRCQERHGVRSLGVPASELLEAPAAWLRPGTRTLLVAISRSGTTTETSLAVAAFREAKAGPVVAVTCHLDSDLAGLADVVLGVPDAQERSVVQTRSFTAMMLAVARLVAGRPAAGIPDRLTAAAAEQLAASTPLVGELGADPGVAHAVLLGQGARYGLACEVMLKVKEASLLPVEAYHTLEVRHGPKAVVGPGSVAVALLPEGPAERERAVVEDLRALGARPLVVAPARDADVPLPTDLPPPWRDVLHLPALQLLAVAWALRRGQDPDRPTNLDAVVRLGA